MYRDCGISWYGSDKRYQVEIRKDVSRFFDENSRDVEIEIDGNTYYSRLPNSFFSTCKHLRTAYDSNERRGKDYLHKWLDMNNVKRAKLEVVEKPVKFKLSKIE